MLRKNLAANLNSGRETDAYLAVYVPLALSYVRYLAVGRLTRKWQCKALVQKVVLRRWQKIQYFTYVLDYDDRSARETWW